MASEAAMPLVSRATTHTSHISSPSARPGAFPSSFGFALNYLNGPAYSQLLFATSYYCAHDAFLISCDRQLASRFCVAWKTFTDARLLGTGQRLHHDVTGCHVTTTTPLPSREGSNYHVVEGSLRKRIGEESSARFPP